MSHIVRLLVAWLYPALFSFSRNVCPYLNTESLSLFALRELFFSLLCGLTVLKLGKRLSGDEPLSLKGSRCLRSNWGCSGRVGTGREARRGLPWADVPARQEGANVRNASANDIAHSASRGRRCCSANGPHVLQRNHLHRQSLDCRLEGKKILNYELLHVTSDQVKPICICFSTDSSARFSKHIHNKSNLMNQCFKLLNWFFSVL